MEYIIYGKKENESYFDVLQEKVKITLEGTNEFKIVPITRLDWAESAKKYYESLGYIVKIKKFDFSKPIDLKKSFINTINKEAF